MNSKRRLKTEITSGINWLMVSGISAFLGTLIGYAEFFELHELLTDVRIVSMYVVAILSFAVGVWLIKKKKQKLNFNKPAPWLTISFFIAVVTVVSSWESAGLAQELLSVVSLVTFAIGIFTIGKKMKKEE